jgi:hypothetical protein
MNVTDYRGTTLEEDVPSASVGKNVAVSYRNFLPIIFPALFSH